VRTAYNYTSRAAGARRHRGLCQTNGRNLFSARRESPPPPSNASLLVALRTASDRVHGRMYKGSSQREVLYAWPKDTTVRTIFLLSLQQPPVPSPATTTDSTSTYQPYYSLQTRKPNPLATRSPPLFRASCIS
jgi:hypothetical protein